MIKQTLLAMCIFCTLQLSAQALPPMPDGVKRVLIMSDGAKLYPAGHIASQHQVDATKGQANALAATVSDQAEQIYSLTTEVASLGEQVADVAKNGIWLMEAYTNSIGILSGIPQYAGSIEIVDLAVSPSQVVVTGWCSQKPLVASQLAMVGAAPSDLGSFSDLEFTCSYPTTVPLPPTKTSGYCYTWTAPISVNRFFKIIATKSSTTGENNGMPIYGPLSVNGAPGRTVSIEAIDAATQQPTTLTFINGVLVDPIAVNMQD